MNTKVSNSVLMIIFVTLVNKSFCINNNNNNNNVGSDLTIISDLPKLRHFNKFTKNTSNNNQNSDKQRDIHENYLIVDYLSDGEMERRFNYNGIIGKETSIGNTSKTLSLWQITNGIGFIQIIYTADDGLIDCEYVRQKHLVHDYIEKFNREVFSAFNHNFTSPILEKTHHKLFTDHEFREFIDYNKLPENIDDENMLIMTTSEHHNYNDIFGMRNLTYKQLNGLTDLPEDMQEFIKFNKLKAQCDEKHKEMKRIVHNLQSNNNNEREVATEHLQRRKRALSDWLIAPNTKWCGRGKTADNYRELGGASRADKCCRKHDHCKFNIPAMTTKWALFNYRPFTISHCNCDMRQRRDLSNLLRVPGTKWCGKGWIADKYSDMGGYSKADRCCRQHDKSCPFWIMGFETKYGLFNWRINTLMHCSCDERFRTCLKMADSSDANMVGKLFFNIIQTKCFVLKPEKVCKKSLWWGKCLKKKILKRAYLRDNQSF